jgi:hypothetical protein
MKSIANQDLSKVLGRANECIRRLIEAGLSYEDLQIPINNPAMRMRLVSFWKNPANANAHKNIFIDRSRGFYLRDWQGKMDWPLREQNHQSQGVTEVDLEAVMLETGLPGDGRWLDIRHRIEALQADGQILLDACVFQSIWEKPESIPAHWKEPIANGKHKSILFAGTFFGPADDKDHFFVPKLYYQDGVWKKGHASSVDYNNDESILIATIMP